MCWGVCVCVSFRVCVCVHVCVLVFVFVSVVCIQFFFFLVVYLCAWRCAAVRLHLLAYTQKQCCKPVKLQKERERVLGGFGTSRGSTLARYESPNKAKGSPYEALWSFYEGQAGPSSTPNHWFRVRRVFVLLMLKVSCKSGVIWPQICDDRPNAVWWALKLVWEGEIEREG